MLHVSAAVRLGQFKLDVQMAVETPGVIALFGKSGCGKSTLINIIAGLQRTERGRVVLNDRCLLDTEADIDLRPEQRRIGYVFQDARLFPHLRVAGNLRYGAARNRHPAYLTEDTVVDLLDLSRLLDRRTHQLSGGERQRVAIGRALLAQPQLLLLDEPLASLDVARREEVLPYLETLRDQLAIPMVYVSHNFDEVLRLATHLVLMDDGAVVARGDIGVMSLHPALRDALRPEELGAIVEGMVVGHDAASQLTRVRLGNGDILLQAAAIEPGTAVRVQVLARDIIVALRVPEALSVRNRLGGRIVEILSEPHDSDLIVIDVGGINLLARITKMATRDLQLRPGLEVVALMKTVSLRGRYFSRVPTCMMPTI